MNFTKMQGLGNDYIYLDGTRGLPEGLPELARRMSDRRLGVGADGLICITRSERADFGMRMFNADGSEGEMCGNGIRCLGKYVYDRGLTEKTALTVETRAGVRQMLLHLKAGRVSAVTVDMGTPRVEAPRTLAIGGQSWTVWEVDMGNPHAVVFVERLEALELARLGPAFEHHPSFPNRTNTEFVAVESPGRLRLRVWERGSGETPACGTGACAALAAAVSGGLCGREAEAYLPGGALSLAWEAQSGRISMTGPAVTVFHGSYPLHGQVEGGGAE